MSDYYLNYSQYENRYNFDFKKYKNSVNKKNNFHFSVIFLIIISLLGTCVFIKPRQTELLEFYFVEIDCFQTYQSALILSQEVTSSGGAGYVYFDGKYHVLASFYSNYDDAESVLENINNDYPSSSVLTISTTPYTTNSNLSSKQNSAVENLLNTSEDLILHLEQLSTSYNKAEISFNNLQLELKNLNEDFASSYDNFLSYFKTNSKFNIAKDYANQMQNSLSKPSEEIEQNMSSRLHYKLVSFVINRYHLLSCF